MKTFIQTVDGEVVTLRFKSTVSDSAVARMINECQYELDRISRRLNKLCGERDALLSKLQAVENEQKFVQKKLGVFSGDIFKKWLEEQKREAEAERREEAMVYAKADDLLMRQIGEVAYAKLVKQGEIVFKGDSGSVFKITQYGQVYRQRDGEWNPLCVIRPKLPVPEQVLAILTTLRNEPNRILRQGINPRR